MLGFIIWSLILMVLLEISILGVMKYFKIK